MSYWVTVKRLSEKYDVSDRTIRSWVEQGYVAHTKINNILYVDEESLLSCLEANARPGMDKRYLERMVRERQEEIDHVIAEYDDRLFLLKTHKELRPLFELVIKALSKRIIDPLACDVFLTVSIGTPIEDVARFHCITYDEVAHIYEETLRQLLCKCGVSPE